MDKKALAILKRCAAQKLIPGKPLPTQEWDDYLARQRHRYGSETKINLRDADLHATLGNPDAIDPQIQAGTMVNLSGFDLRNVDFEGANLKHVILIGADLREANLRRATLNFSDLTGANLRNAKFEDAYLIGAILQKADLSGADLSYINAWGQANLLSAKLVGTNLFYADLEGANLQLSDCSGANMQGIRLRKADLSFAILDRGPDGRPVVLSGASMDDAILEGVNLSQVIYSGDEFKAPGIRGVSEQSFVVSPSHSTDKREPPELPYGIALRDQEIIERISARVLQLQAGMDNTHPSLTHQTRLKGGNIGRNADGHYPRPKPKTRH